MVAFCSDNQLFSVFTHVIFVQFLLLIDVFEQSINLNSYNMNKEVLTFSEAAEYTGLSKSYLYKLTSTQKIPHYKPMGKCVFFNRIELEAFLQQNRVETSDAISAKAANYCTQNTMGGGR